MNTLKAISFTPEELDTLYWALAEYYRYDGTNEVLRLQNKVDFFRPVKSSDLGRSSALSPVEVGQGGNL